MAHYQLNYTLHLPADKPWRDVSQNKKRLATAQDPVALCQISITDILQLVLLDDANLVVGTVVDFINHFDEEVRNAIVDGVEQGLTVRLFDAGNKPGAGMVPKYKPLSRAVPVKGGRVRKSGILIPDAQVPGGE